MAKNDYSADSAPLPQPLSGMGLTGTTPYIGERTDLVRRLSEHVSVRRKAGPSTPTPISID
jgi:hypothetical protein